MLFSNVVRAHKNKKKLTKTKKQTKQIKGVGPLQIGKHFLSGVGGPAAPGKPHPGSPTTCGGKGAAAGTPVRLGSLL